MILRNLSLTDFKNITDASLEFSPKINCLLGNNGMGKSNLLDALYFLSLCKSFTGANDSLLIKQGAPYSAIRAAYLRKGLDEEITVALQPNKRKVFKRCGKPYKRIAEHLGVFPIVLLSPADMELTAGEPAERRRFIDQIIAQRDARYYDALLKYNSALEQRNRLLRDEAQDDSLFDVLEMQLELAGNYISHARENNIEALRNIFAPYFNHIADNTENATITYTHSDYSERGGLAGHLALNRTRDRALHYTASGPHRDDILFTVDGLPVRRSASQGQAKTFTTALRFAQYELLREALGLKPILLLDDIFDKLDAGRVERIINLVGSSDTFGQIFITDTNRRHLDETVSSMKSAADYALWSVDNGNFTAIEA